MTVQDGTVIIPKSEYERLIEAEEFLNCLRAAGVDNWSGYDDAREMMNEE